ncbi:MAG: ABC transporter ATP-binding protein [Coriobacteriales bacterium]|nr:ABC transporter ATP-binding protein [Coriobacteriales bacterium]
MGRTILQTHDLIKRYGDFTALKRVSLSLYEGDIYGLVGRNGAGKTTFFKCVMGLARPNSGSIVIGEAGDKLNAARHRMGFMINASFFPYLGPRESLEYLCRVKKIPARREEVTRLLKLVELDTVKKPFKTFSQGMKQRLGIAGALLGSPSIVVLDEPINGLDPQGIADIRDIIKSAHQVSGATFIISSHILSELDLVATRFGFIEQGVLLREITHEELHAQTKKSLTLRVSDAVRAQALLQSQPGGIQVSSSGDCLTIESHLDEPQLISRMVVEGGIELFEMRHAQTTLEDYFIHLIRTAEAAGLTNGEDGSGLTNRSGKKGRRGAHYA